MRTATEVFEPWTEAFEKLREGEADPTVADEAWQRATELAAGKPVRPDTGGILLQVVRPGSINHRQRGGILVHDTMTYEDDWYPWQQLGQARAELLDTLGLMHEYGVVAFKGLSAYCDHLGTWLYNQPTPDASNLRTPLRLDGVLHVAEYNIRGGAARLLDLGAPGPVALPPELSQRS